jgi:hypothetical protein
MTKLKFSLQKALLVVAGLVALVVAVPVLYVTYDTHNTSVDFQEYAPKVLPTGVTIAGRELKVWSDRVNPLVHTKELSFTLNSRTSALLESKNFNFAYACDTQILNVTCVIAETPQHQRYRLETSYSPTLDGQAFEETAEWLRGDTHIMMMLRGNPLRQHAQDEWERVIDSFVPVHYRHITITQHSPGP